MSWLCKPIPFFTAFNERSNTVMTRLNSSFCAETRHLVDHRAKRAKRCGHTVRYIPVMCSHGPAAARNIGWQAARGEVIAFTDDDCIPTSQWLKAGLAALADGVVGVAGRIIVPLTGMPTDYEYKASYLAQCEFATANCFYRRSALMGVGGFDERFTAPWREDSDLIFTLLECSAKCTKAPDAIVIHPVRPARWGVSIYQQRKSMFNALLYKKHPALYRQKIQVAPPWHYYCIIGALLVVLVGATTGSGLVALVGLADRTLLCATTIAYVACTPSCSGDDSDLCHHSTAGDFLAPAGRNQVSHILLMSGENRYEVAYLRADRASWAMQSSLSDVFDSVS